MNWRGYNLSENNNNLLLGYAYIQSNNYQGEHQRIRSRSIEFINSLLQNKYLEGHIGGIDIVLSNDLPTILKCDYAIFKRKGAIKQHEVRSWNIFLSGYNELFMNVKKDTAFDRNRLYGGMGYQVNSFIKLELGYMNQFLASTNRDQLNVFMFAKF